MRVVIDTNVFISGLFFGGIPAKILDAWHDRLIQPVVSMEILQEYRGTAENLSLKYPGIDFSRFMEWIAINVEIVREPVKKKPITADSDDDKFFRVALQAEIEYIISGDRHLLDVSPYKFVKVVKPRYFYHKFLGGKTE